MTKAKTAQLKAPTPQLIEAVGKHWLVKFSFNRMVAAEEKAGKDMPEILLALKTGTAFSLLRDLFWAGLQQVDGGHATDDEAGEVIDVIGAQRAAEMIAAALESVFEARPAAVVDPRD